MTQTVKGRPAGEPGGTRNQAGGRADVSELTRSDRRRLVRRVDELSSIAAIMRQPGTLAEPPEPEVIGHE